MKAPHFWSHKGGISTLLIGASWLYRFAGWCRALTTTPYHAALPVICVGNITSGGTGKTPVTAALAKLAIAQGLRPIILTRGYGGTITTPTLIDRKHHSATDCGDEPLLLAQYADVVVARNRAKGAQFIEQIGAYDVIIMDDGMQNPQLHKDTTICVFDGAIGTQNNRIFPAGPLRAPLSDAAKRADLIMINGADETGLSSFLADKPLITFTLEADGAVPPVKKSMKAYAFAGIGRPQRFFDTLNDAGYYLVQTKSFGDHHPYSQTDITDLVDAARALSAVLITTEKDWVRLDKSCREHISYLPVSLQLSQKDSSLLASILPSQGR